MSWVLVFIGGGTGSLFRFAIGKYMVKYALVFPFATLISNIVASLLMVIFVNQFKTVPKESFYFLLVTGFCGGFSTFSAFSYETATLFQNGNTIYALTNVVVSVVACIFIAWMLMKS